MNRLDRSRAVSIGGVLIDTGATLTTIPRAGADAIRLTVDDREEVRTAAGVGHEEAVLPSRLARRPLE